MDPYQIQTAQNVSINQQIATVRDRILAYFIDWAVILLYIIAIAYLTLALSNLQYSSMQTYSYFLIVSLPIFLYDFLWESLWNGRSPGKAFLKIRVVKLDGSKPRLSNFIIRWALRPIDLNIFGGVVALVFILARGKGQRLGDLAAGTLVISEKKKISFTKHVAKQITENYEPKYPQVTVFSDHEIYKIQQIYTDAKKNKNHKLILHLANKISALMSIPIDQEPQLFVETVIKDYSYYTQ